MGRLKLIRFWLMVSALILGFGIWDLGFVHATPSTHIWSPSTDIQPYKKTHITADTYTPTHKRDINGNRVYVQQVYGLTFSLLSDKPEGNGLASDSQSHKPGGNGLASDSQSHKPEENLLGKLWQPLGKIMAETGFDYKKGFGSFYDTYPWYFHFKFAVPEGAYFKNMPALAIGGYDLGVKHNKTDYRVWYLKAAKTISAGKFNLGRFSAGFFNGNVKLLRDKDSLRDNIGPMLAWERVIPEVSEKLWLCVDYQGTQSSYGAVNYGFAWKFTNNISAILGYEVYNNPNLRDTITFQLDVDF